ncbi:hypothetical protein K5X82_14295 [Halosquirtibacter xylanolyticus]|uniref:hypothetical protein n=1 Tax=Halosquirtibacter xylanolyticus TaxID=3374599 RepID=UPI00374A9193|nr:hypothetical protein K5X82_14295 [Prolixibacteraceae bacterium]
MRKITFLFIVVLSIVSCSEENKQSNIEAHAMERQILEIIREHHVKEVYVRDRVPILNPYNSFTDDFEVGGGMIRVDLKWYYLKRVERMYLAPGNRYQGLVIDLKEGEVIMRI